MKKKHFVVLMSVFFLFGLTSATFAITDPSGNNSGSIDIIAAYAETYLRGDDTDLLKLHYLRFSRRRAQHKCIDIEIIVRTNLAFRKGSTPAFIDRK